jgi:basic membrane protein A
MQQEGTFLLGALAAMMSKTGVIGYVGGDQYPNLINIFEGYKQGAKSVNSNIKVIGTYLGEWDNPAKGKEAGLAQINQGADFLFHVADTSGHGVFQAAKEKGVYAFGAVGDQNKLAPDTVLTSFVLDIDKAFDRAVKLIISNKFEGKIYKPGIEARKNGPGDGIVYLAPFHDLASDVPKDVKLKLKKLTRDVLKGKIKVPERYEATP